MNSWNPAEIMERLLNLERKIKANDVIANPTGEATDTLEKVSIDGDIYSIEGTTVEANPEGAATAELSKLQVGETVYSIPAYTPFDFSTTEVDTGSKWIDNKEIYCKVVELSKSDFSAANDYHYSYDLKTALGAETLIDISGNYTIGSYGTSIIGLPTYVINNGDTCITNGNYYGYFVLHSYPSGQSGAIKFSDQATITAKIICYYTKVTTQAKKSSKKKED